MIIFPRDETRPARWLAWSATIAVLAFAPSGRAEVPWQLVSGADAQGVTLEKRAVPGSKFFEYRATAISPASPTAVLRGIWTGVTEELPSTVKQRKVLQRSPDEILFYDQIRTPVVSDRDFTIRIWWKRDEPTGVIEVPFATVNDRGPPPAAGHVRVPAIHGDWIIAPLASPDGEPRTRITFLCYSDPGGSIPAFMARGAQQDQVMIDIHRILARASQASRSTAAR
jgi:hypothetical protein